MSKPSTEVRQLGVVPISRASMQVLADAGLAAETIGLQRLGSGSALISLEIAQDIKADLQKAIMACEEPEQKAALVNAYANLVKSEASTLKVVGVLPSAQQEGSKRARKSFAPAAPIDVSSKTQ